MTVEYETSKMKKKMSNEYIHIYRATRKVFSRCLKTESGGADVMVTGSLFHRLAPNPGNVRFTICSKTKVWNCQTVEDADLSLCQLGIHQRHG